MGANASSEQPSPDSTLVRVPRYTLEEKRKKTSKLNTLKKKLTKSRSTFKSQDHGKMLRDLTQTWTRQEINALVEEYETMMNVKDLKNQTNLVRPSASCLKKDLQKLYEVETCADCTLVFEGTSFNVHRAILSSRCPYFRELFTQHMGEHPIIQMEFKTEGMTKEIFSALLCYLYTGDFTPKKSGLEYIDVLINLGDEFGTPNVLEQDFKLLLNCSEYADVALVFPAQASMQERYSTSDGGIISDHNYEILCHKAVLCARSQYFRSLFLKDCLHSLEQSSKVQRLVIDESVMTRQYARIALQCMYTDSVDLSSIVKWSSDDRGYCAFGTHKLLTLAEIAMEVFEVASFIDLPVLIQGCEDIILEELSPSTLLCTLEWSSCAHGSDWVYRQAMQFLQDEFVNIAQSEVFPFLPKKYLVETLKSDFLQACEHDVLLAVIRWGEAQVIRNMNEQDVFQEGKKNTKRREVDNKQLKIVLSGVIEHVRMGHVIPTHSDVLEGVFRRGLADRGMPLDIGEGSFYPNIPWMRRRQEKDFVRPRLFLPYFEEAKIILQEHRKAEQELQRHRLSRFSQNMPDTLYMIEPQKRRNTAPGFIRAASDAGRLEQEQLLSTSETLRAEENELDRYVRARRSTQMSSDSGEIESTGAGRLVEREFALPDVAMELPSFVPNDQLGERLGLSEIHDFGAQEISVNEFLRNPVPDVALPSSPTSSVSSTGVPLEYFQVDQPLEAMDEDNSSSSGLAAGQSS